MATIISDINVTETRETRLRRLWNHAASDWGQAPSVALVLVILPVIIAATGVAAGVISKDLYKWFTGEDGFAENLQVLFFFTAAVLSFAHARDLRARRENVAAPLYLLAGLALLFIVGEEISWGQRIFGWSTPEGMVAVNRQDETNLHNVYGIEAALNWALILVTAAGTFLPLLLLASNRTAQRVPLLPRIVPHFSLVLYFALPFSWRVYRLVGPVPEAYRFAISEYAEVMELIFALGLFLVLLHQRRAIQTRPQSAHRPL